MADFRHGRVSINFLRVAHRRRCLGRCPITRSSCFHPVSDLRLSRSSRSNPSCILNALHGRWHCCTVLALAIKYVTRVLVLTSISTHLARHQKRLQTPSAILLKASLFRPRQVTTLQVI